VGDLRGFDRRDFLLKALRFFDTEEDDDGDCDWSEAAPEHGSPAVASGDGVVEGGGEKESCVVAGLEVAGAHLAAVFGPRFGDVGSGESPLAADADAGEEAEESELPDGLDRAASPVKRA